MPDNEDMDDAIEKEIQDALMEDIELVAPEPLKETEPIKPKRGRKPKTESAAPADLPRKTEETPAKSFPEESKKRGRKKAKLAESDVIGATGLNQIDSQNQVTPLQQPSACEVSAGTPAAPEEETKQPHLAVAAVGESLIPSSNQSAAPS